MKIIVEEIKKKPDFNIIETTPYTGVKKVKVSVEIEKGEIIDFPYILYVNDLSNIIGRNQENEFVYENLCSSSKKRLDEWIEEKLNS
jgi:hypothetical protein